MSIIKGTLDPFFETGTEGIIWSVYETGKTGYDGLNCLENGDYLKIFDINNPILLIWEGIIDLEWERNYRKYPNNLEYGQQEIGGFWVRGIQSNVTPTQWKNWFFAGNPAELIKAKDLPKLDADWTFEEEEEFRAMESKANRLL